MLLDVRNLSVAHQGAPVIQFPDFKVARGEKVALLGHSGSGKTTLLSIIAGLLKPATGGIMFDGQGVYSLTPRERDALRGQNFGFVFQSLHLLPALTLRQNIALASDMAGLTRNDKRVDYLLNTLGLAEKANRKPEALSQGEQQRAAIARAMLNHPKVILADEPTSALDDINANTVIELLTKQAQETGAALIVATHDKRVVAHFSQVIRLNVRAGEAA